MSPLITLIRRLTKLRPGRRGWILLAVAGGLLSSFAADSVASIGQVRPGVSVSGLELGGLTRAEAEARLTERAELIATEPVELFTGGHRIEVDPQHVGFSPDVEATLDDAMGVGRDGNIPGRLWQRFRTYFTNTDLEWASEINRSTVRELMVEWSERFDEPAREASFRAQGETITPVEPRAGQRLDHGRTFLTIVSALETHPRRSAELPFEVISHNTTAQDAADAAERARSLIRAPITLASPEGSVELEPAELAQLLEAVPEAEGGTWRVVVRFSPAMMADQLSERMLPFEREPVSASFAVNGSSVSINPSIDGTKFDPEGTATNLDDAAREDAPRTAEVAFTPVEPPMTTEQAEALGIKEQVSSFTTNFRCCPPRVTNIRLMAEAVNDTIVPPGQTFSLNQHVGRRTEEKGYLPAPMIFDGEYQDSVGGGVSQFATTFFNAVFFGGYRVETYQAHSYYISRYPAGREATISWPNPDLRFTNNSSAGILIRSWATDTSVTVAFYGDIGGKQVLSESGERTNFTDPPEERRRNPELPPGSQRVVQSGSQGFDIVVWRIITTPDGNTERERFFTRYLPEPRIIEEGPPAPEPTPTPEPDEDEDDPPEPTPAPEPDEDEDQDEDEDAD